MKRLASTPAVLGVLLALAWVGCGPAESDAVLGSDPAGAWEEVDAEVRGASISVHTTMGLPDRATDKVSNREHYLSVKRQYVISYNTDRKVPNWTSWELNSDDIGDVPRSEEYREDDTLPDSLPQASLEDYRGSGFHRGHLCPAKDRSANERDNDATFYLTNMVPQAPENNAGPWEDLEAYERELARDGKELFIIAGGIFSRGHRTVGDGVAVPDSTWKVIVVLDHVGQGARDVDTSTRVIAVNIPNDDREVDQTDEWTRYRVSVDEIEDATGFNLLSDVDRRVQAALESEVGR